MMELIRTTQYDDFKVILSNRELDKRHVKKLADSIKQKNLLFVRPIIVNSNMEVIDGQHRLAAAEQINEPVYYIKCDGLTKEDIAVLNTAQKNWTRLDFINFYAIEGRPAFKELSRLINKYPRIKISVMLRAFGEGRKLRQGELSLNGLNYAMRFCQTIAWIEGTWSFVNDAAFGNALVEVATKAELSKLVTISNISPELLHKCESKPEYKKLLTKILKDYADKTSPR